MPSGSGETRRRPYRLRHPAARYIFRIHLPWRGIGHVGSQHGLVHDSGVDALQPLLPPANLLVDPIESGPRVHGVRIVVTPRTDQALARNRQVLEEPADDVRVRVDPAIEDGAGAFYRRIVHGDRAALPV